MTSAAPAAMPGRPAADRPPVADSMSVIPSYKTPSPDSACYNNVWSLDGHAAVSHIANAAGKHQ